MDYDQYDEAFEDDDNFCRYCERVDGTQYVEDAWVCDSCADDFYDTEPDPIEDQWLEGYWEDRLTSIYQGE